MYLIYLLTIISYITLLPFDKAQVDAVDTCITIKPIPVRLNVLELDVVAITTNVSNDFKNVIVLNFLYFFFNLLFISLKCVITSLILLIEILKQCTSFIFF